MNALKHEFGHAWRSFMSAPGFFGMAILAMALGLAATTFMYSAGSNYLVAVPMENPEEVIHLGFIDPTNPNRTRDSVISEYLDFNQQLKGVDGLGAFRTRTINVSGGEVPQRYNGAEISASAFKLIGSSPLMGRVIQEVDMQRGAEPVVILGFDVWQNRYQSDQSIIGKQIRVNGVPTRVIAVMAADFRYPRVEEIWIPLNLHIPEGTPRLNSNSVEAIGRLKSGVTLDNLQDEARTVASRMKEIYPEDYENWTSYVQTYSSEFVGSSTAQVIYTLFGTSIMVLLIACANVANLFLALGARRKREQAIQAALGASRGRLILRALLESFIVCGFGGVIGLVLGIYVSRIVGLMIIASDPNIPFWIAQVLSREFEFDGQNMQAISYGFVAMVFATLVAGIVPALRMSRPDINTVLKANETAAASGSHNRFSRWLVITEIALACSLLIGASLLLRSSTNLNNIEIGVNTDKVITSRVGLFDNEYQSDAEKVQYYQQLKNELSSQPGIEKVGLTLSIPGGRAPWYYFSKLGDSFPRDRDYPVAKRVVMSSEMDEIYGISLLQGRMFDQRDMLDSQPVAIISESMANKYWPEGNAIGQQIRMGASTSERPWRTVIGIMPYMNYQGASGPDTMRDTVYEPINQSPAQYFTIVVKTVDDERKYAAVIAKAVSKVNPDQPVYWQRTLTEWVEINQFYQHLQTNIMGVFAVLALVLASVGIYGVLSYSISQRTREFGIRRAMGADERNVMITVFKQGLLQLAYGTFIGLVLAVGLAKAVESQLVLVSAFDPVSFIFVPLTLAAITLFASWYPATKAAMIQPMMALRYE